MTPSILDTLEAAEKAATAGPWEYHAGVPPWVREGTGVTGSVYAHEGEMPVVWKPRTQDAALIALLRNHAADLIAVARAAQEYQRAGSPRTTFGATPLEKMRSALVPLLPPDGSSEG